MIKDPKLVDVPDRLDVVNCGKYNVRVPTMDGTMYKLKPGEVMTVSAGVAQNLVVQRDDIRAAKQITVKQPDEKPKRGPGRPKKSESETDPAA